MANITDYLNGIKSAVYGKEVRGAIHDAIKQVYDDASVNHDNANMEVKMARGTYNTLNDRLNKTDEIQAQTNAQLSDYAKKEDVAKISSGTPLFAASTSEMTDATRNYVNTSDGYLYIHNGSTFEKTTVKYQETGITDKSISSAKIDDEFVYDIGIYESAKLVTISNMINNFDFRKNMSGWLLEYNTTGVISGNEIEIKPVALGRLKSVSLGKFNINDTFYFRCDYKTTGVAARCGIVTTSNNNYHPGYIDIPNTQQTFGTYSGIARNIIDQCDLSFEVLANSVKNTGDTFTIRNILIVNLKELFPDKYMTITKDEVEDFIARYTNNVAFLKQSTDIVKASHFITDTPNLKGKFYVSKSGSRVAITYKYTNDTDLKVIFDKRGGNNIFDLHSMQKINNKEDIVNTGDGVNFYTSYTDTFGPYIVGAVGNIDGDNPSANGHFTGGNHNYNNDGTTGVYTATGRSSDIKVVVDGIQKDSIGEYASVVDIYWTNFIQGYNTKKSDGSGREILKENYHIRFDGEKFYCENFIEALEDVEIRLYYGMQLSYSSWNDGVLYLNSSVRTWQSGTGGHWGRGKKCNRMLFKKGNDIAEMYMSYEGLGDKELSNTDYGAVTMNYAKSYFYPLNIPTTFVKGSVLHWNGYYKFYSKI